MKCVRCGISTDNESSFCEKCENFVKNGPQVTNQNGESFEVNWGYMLVTLSVIAVAIMLAIIVYSTR